jgi:hypothetical protein
MNGMRIVGNGSGGPGVNAMSGGMREGEIMKHLIGFALCPLLLMCLATDAVACSCRAPAPQIAYEKSEAVFVGEFTGFTKSQYRRKRVSALRFKVKKRWKGDVASTITLPYTDTRGWCNDLSFKKGHEYLIYANSWGGELLLMVDFCNRSRSVNDAAEDFKYLEQLSSHPNGPPNNGTHPTANSVVFIL